MGLTTLPLRHAKLPARVFCLMLTGILWTSPVKPSRAVLSTILWAADRVQL